MPRDGRSPRPRLWVMVLAGGRGERLWPLSRVAAPKPLLPLADGKSLLRATLSRALSVAPRQRIRIVAGSGLAGAIRADLGEGWTRRILREPAARNTGAACLLAARWLAERDPRAAMLILPSDHRIGRIAAFRRDVRRALVLAGRECLVTFALPPMAPSPEFGYLLPGKPLGREGRRVSRFVEKPPAARARALVRRGALWNSGIFCWTAQTFLDEARKVEPAYRRWLGRPRRAASRSFAELPSLPVDRAVLERSGRVALVRAGFSWSDVGSWETLLESRGKRRSGSLTSIGARGNLVHLENGRCVLWDVDDLAVLQGGDTLLVCPRARLASLRDLLGELRLRGWSDGR